MHTHEELIQICTIDVLSIELNLLAGILGNINDNIMTVLARYTPLGSVVLSVSPKRLDHRY